MKPQKPYKIVRWGEVAVVENATNGKRIGWTVRRLVGWYGWPIPVSGVVERHWRLTLNRTASIIYKAYLSREGNKE